MKSLIARNPCVGASLRVLVTGACVALLSPSALLAQEKDDDKATKLEEVVVTGTAAGAEVRKLDASFAITTLDDEDITQFSPQSTADLLRLIPGVWTESTGGVAGANIMVRGFPGGGDAPYYTLQVNGVPVYPISTLSFLENSTLFRIDETVRRVEALRGGPNPVFSNGQSGLTTNFILREGSEETEGIIKYTISDYDLKRFDGYISGEIADDFYYSVGGYLSSSPGLRDAGYNSDEGNQFTINLTRVLEKGKVNIFHRQTDDYGQWYLPVALNVPGANDAGYNQQGPLNRLQEIMTDNPGPGFPNGGDSNAVNPTIKTLDLKEGRGWKGSMTGGSVVLDISDNWTLVDRFGFTKGDADTVGLVPDGTAVQVSALLANPAVDPLAVVIGPITGAVTGRAIGGSEYIQRFGSWEVRKDIESFVNDISLTTGFDRGSATFGFYTSSASSHDLWSLGNHVYQVVEQGGETISGSSIACNNPAIDSCNWNYDIDEIGDVTSQALYAATSYDITDALRADVGLRYEMYEIDYTLDEGRAGTIDFAASDDLEEVSWTAALNYQFTDRMGVFGRINQGHLLPQFDTYRDGRSALALGADLVQDIDQYEAGFKWGTDNLALYATGFYTNVDPRQVNFQFGGDAILTKQKSQGVELDAVWRTDGGFSLSFNGTFLESKISTSDPSIDGNETERQPGWQVRVTPSYDFSFGNIEGTVYGTIAAVDDRWSSAQNIVSLDGYEKLDLGVIMRVNESFIVQLAADNVTDEQGITEGDPRNESSPNGRFIMPQSIELSVGYQF